MDQSNDTYEIDRLRIRADDDGDDDDDNDDGDGDDDDDDDGVARRGTRRQTGRVTHKVGVTFLRL